MQKLLTICMTTFHLSMCAVFNGAVCFKGGYDGKESERNYSKRHFSSAVPLCCEFEVVFRLRENGRGNCGLRRC